MSHKDPAARREYQHNRHIAQRNARLEYMRERRKVKGCDDESKRAPAKREYDKTRRKQKREYWWKIQGISQPTRPETLWCECCGRMPEKTMHLDHDHNTGQFRGWICQQCNHALGLLGDCLEGAEKAVAYLKRAQ